MANRDFFQNGRWFREITYGSGSTKIVPLDGPYKSNASIGQGFAERLYNRTPTPFASLEETTLPTLGARSSFNFRPTSASGGQGLFSLPINQIPSSGKVFALGGEVSPITLSGRAQQLSLLGGNGAGGGGGEFGTNFTQLKLNLGKAPVNINTAAFRPILGGAGIAASAFADPTFNQNVLVPSISTGVGFKLLQNYGITPLFQQLGKSNTFGFSQAPAGLEGIRENTTLFRGSPFRATLPTFGQTIGTLAAFNAGRSLFLSLIHI